MGANAMAGPSLQDAWVTSPYWNTYHQDAWLDDGYWPAAPTGADICITKDAANETLAAGFGPGCVGLFSVADYGQNWVNVKSLGKGAKVVATLPPKRTPSCGPQRASRRASSLRSASPSRPTISFTAPLPHARNWTTCPLVQIVVPHQAA